MKPEHKRHNDARAVGNGVFGGKRPAAKRVFNGKRKFEGVCGERRGALGGNERQLGFGGGYNAKAFL